MVETSTLLNPNKTETAQFQQNAPQELFGTKQALSSEIDRPYENVPPSSTIPATVTSMATGSTIPPLMSDTSTMMPTMASSTLPTSTMIGGSTFPASTMMSGPTAIPTTAYPATTTFPTTTAYPAATTLPPTATTQPTSTTGGALSKWQRRRQAKKLRKQQKKMGMTGAAPVAATSTGTGSTFGTNAHLKEVDHTMHEKFYSMPVLAGQATPMPVSTMGTTTMTGGPKLTRKEKRAWKKREKKEAAALNTSMAGMTLSDRKLLHDLKHDKLGPIHPAAVQQPPAVVTTSTTSTIPITTTTSTIPMASTTSNVIGTGTTPVMNI